MKRLLTLFALLGAATASVGCHHNTCPHCGRAHGHRAARQADYVPRAGHGVHRQQYAGPAGPPTAAVAYPYYTVRAPRDFLLDNPPSIGY